jgi:hypothetical protein
MFLLYKNPDTPMRDDPELAPLVGLFKNQKGMNR